MKRSRAPIRGVEPVGQRTIGEHPEFGKLITYHDVVKRQTVWEHRKPDGSLCSALALTDEQRLELGDKAARAASDREMLSSSCHCMGDEPKKGWNFRQRLGLAEPPPPDWSGWDGKEPHYEDFKE